MKGGIPGYGRFPTKAAKEPKKEEPKAEEPKKEDVKDVLKNDEPKKEPLESLKLKPFRSKSPSLPSSSKQSIPNSPSASSLGKFSAEDIKDLSAQINQLKADNAFLHAKVDQATKNAIKDFNNIRDVLNERSTENQENLSLARMDTDFAVKNISKQLDSLRVSLDRVVSGKIGGRGIGGIIIQAPSVIVQQPMEEPEIDPEILKLRNESLDALKNIKEDVGGKDAGSVCHGGYHWVYTPPSSKIKDENLNKIIENSNKVREINEKNRIARNRLAQQKFDDTVRKLQESSAQQMEQLKGLLGGKNINILGGAGGNVNLLGEAKPDEKPSIVSEQSAQKDGNINNIDEEEKELSNLNIDELRTLNNDLVSHFGEDDVKSTVSALKSGLAPKKSLNQSSFINESISAFKDTTNYVPQSNVSQLTVVQQRNKAELKPQSINTSSIEFVVKPEEREKAQINALKQSLESPKFKELFSLSANKPKVRTPERQYVTSRQPAIRPVSRLKPSRYNPFLRFALFQM